ncbi:DUF1772 domain-containing protein [Amycolatopsis japonica]|uniref:anthrone oxygenase family protein n=1 Tax=Amycolatopsis japonica TaxID=208439 RepID=UPI00331B4DAE
MTVVSVLATTVTVTSGVVAGVLFAVALSVLPALLAMPTDRYIYAHKLIGRKWDPTMPVIVLGSTTVEVVLAFTAPGDSRPLFAIGAVLLLVVSIVSHYCNVPINRRVKSVDPHAVPTNWTDPRPLWRRWHLLRTAVAMVAAVLNATALALL